MVHQYAYATASLLSLTPPVSANSIETKMNSVLHNITINGAHVSHCFCLTCRAERKTELEQCQLSMHELFNTAFGRLLRREEVQLNALFRNTLKRIVMLKVYHDKCIQSAHGRYSRWGAWARTQPQFARGRISEKYFKRISSDVRQACFVYAGWDNIVRNLTDPRITNIDVRKLSINQLYRFRNMANCIDYNESLRTPGTNEDPAYPEYKLQNIMRFINDTGIIEDVDEDPSRVTMIGRRIQSEMTRSVMSD